MTDPADPASQEAQASTRVIGISFARPGMSLSRPAVPENGRIIFTTGTVLDKGKIKILRNTYIRHIYIIYDSKWDLPADAFAGDPDSDDGGAVVAVSGLLASIQGLNTELVREKKLGVETLKTMGAEIFSRIQHEPVFEILLQVDSHANYLFGHMVNVAVLTVAVTRNLKMASKDIWNIFVSGLMFDVGMLHVREELWLSDKKLKESQIDEVRRHTEFGYNAIRRARGVDEAWALPALEHHERVDGSGYPDGKDGRVLQIPSRVIAVCDVYGALIRDRTWRKAFRPDEAIRQMIAGGSQFDREILAHLAKTLGVYPVGTIVKLSDGRTGEVVAVNPVDPLRPVVEVQDGGAAERVTLADQPALSVLSVLSGPKGKGG